MNHEDTKDTKGVWPRLIHGDARTVLRTLESESVHVCVTSPPYFGLRRYLPEGHPDEALQLGLEDSPEAWVENLVAVFREVKRVPRADGTLWVNCGDCYSSGGRAARQPNGKNNAVCEARPDSGVKPKDLLGLPWMLAFALRADGWYLRSAITWCKPAPMPESVTDRCTAATEMLFMFARQETYFYDATAIAEPCVKGAAGSLFTTGKTGVNGMGRTSERPRVDSAMRNKRNWWVVNSQATPETHFATFPEALAEPCILAGSPLGGVVLDPFVGSGTTCRVAMRLGRKSIGIDLNATYLAEIAARRTEQGALGI